MIIVSRSEKALALFSEIRSYELQEGRNLLAVGVKKCP